MDIKFDFNFFGIAITLGRGGISKFFFPRGTQVTSIIAVQKPFLSVLHCVVAVYLACRSFMRNKSDDDNGGGGGGGGDVVLDYDSLCLIDRARKVRKVFQVYAMKIASTADRNLDCQVNVERRVLVAQLDLVVCLEQPAASVFQAFQYVTSKLSNHLVFINSTDYFSILLCINTRIFNYVPCPIETVLLMPR